MEEIIKLLREKEEREDLYKLKLVIFGDESGWIERRTRKTIENTSFFDNEQELIEWLKK